MTPAELLTDLRSRGLSCRSDGTGRLLVSPKDRLAAEDCEAIREARDAILAILDQEAGQSEWAAVADALCKRAWIDPPEFGDNASVLRESVILRLEGMPIVAASVEEAGCIEASRLHSKSVNKRWRELGRKKAERKR